MERRRRSSGPGLLACGRRSRGRRDRLYLLLEKEKFQGRGTVTYWDEAEVEDTPDYVEAPVECADARGCDFDDHEVKYPRGLVR